ncbi:FUSC family protein [Halomonas sp. I5-271120]|uniref:FUSC family protein n=1 Tax=Halomonas sp. I5-271120 TaxID=3061632 RepID=UPI002714BF40|nr:FUSC family protein [Halomonas sp. I5-271120]
MPLPRLRDPYINYRNRHLLHVMRVTLALTITFAFIDIFKVPHASWALVSTVMVMGNLPHIGGVLDKGRQRLIGTVLGAAWGILITLAPNPPPLVVPIWTLAGIAAATYVTFKGRYGYSGLMFAISLLLVVGDGTQELGTALWRSFNVLVGTLIGILVTAFAMPQKATDVQRFLMAETLDKLARLYHAHTSSTGSPDLDTQPLLKSSSSLVIKQRGLVDAIHRERRLRREELDTIISLERRMLSTIELLLETHWTTRDGHDHIAAMEGLRDQQHRLARDLGTLAFQVRTGQPIDVELAPFDLERYATNARQATATSGRALFSPAGYLWLNRELARLTQELVDTLSELRRLPSQRLRKRAKHHVLTTHTTLPDDSNPQGPAS